MSGKDSKGDDGLGSGRSHLDFFDELNHSYFNDKPSDSTFSKKEAPQTSQKDIFAGKSGQSSTRQPLTGAINTTSTLRSPEPVDKTLIKGGHILSSDLPKDQSLRPSSSNHIRLPAKTGDKSSGAAKGSHYRSANEYPNVLDHHQGLHDFSKANTSTKASFSGAKQLPGDKLTTTAFALQTASESVRPAPSPDEVTKFEQMIRKSSCRKTTIIFSMEWLGVKVKSACMLKGLNDLLSLVDEQTEGSPVNLNNTKTMVSNCTKLLNNLYSQAHAKMSIETDPAKKQLIELGMDEKVGLIRFHVSISQFRQAFNSLTNLAVRLCQKKGKSLYNEVMTVSRVNVLTLEQEVIYKVGTQTGEQLQLSNKQPLGKVFDEDSAGSDSHKPEGPQTKVYKKDGHKDGKLVQSYEVAVEEQRNGFYSSTASNVKSGEKKTLLWEAKYPHAPGLDIVIYFLVIKEISPILFWSMKREISSKQLNDIERYGQMIKIYLLPQDEKLKASKVFDFATGKQIEDELIDMELPPKTRENIVPTEPAPVLSRPPKEQPAVIPTAPSHTLGSEIKLSSDPMDELIFQRRDMILQNPFCLSQLQPRQILILIEQVIDRNHTIRYLNLGETFRRADFYRQQVSVRAVINACAKITMHHLKKIHGIEFKVLRLKLGEEHYSSRLFFDGKAIVGRQAETVTLEYPDYDGLIFSESIHLLHLVFKEQLEYLNVKEYVGRLKTSFEKPFMLTAAVLAPASSAQKEVVQPRAPPAPVVAAPITSKTKSLLADLDLYPMAVKQQAAPEVKSAGKGLQPKHLQAGSHVLQRLAMLASVSRANPEDELDSGRTSLEKTNRLLAGEGKKVDSPQNPLNQVAGIAKPHRFQEIPQPALGSSCHSESGGDFEGSFHQLGKRKPLKSSLPENKHPKPSLTSSKLTSNNKSGAPAGSVSAGKLTGNLVDQITGHKIDGSSHPAESVQDSRVDNTSSRPKRKIKISKEDIQTIQVISAVIDKPPLSQDLPTDSRRSSREPSSSKKQVPIAVTRKGVAKAHDPKQPNGAESRTNDQTRKKAKVAKGDQEASTRQYSADSQDSSSRYLSTKSKPKEPKLLPKSKNSQLLASDDQSTTTPKAFKHKPASDQLTAAPNNQKPLKAKKNNQSISKQTTKEKKLQQPKTNKTQTTEAEQSSSCSLSVQSLPSHDFDTSQERIEQSEEEVPPRHSVVRRRKKKVRVSPVARKTPSRLTCEPSQQDIEVVEAFTDRSDEISEEQSHISNPESALTTSEEPDSEAEVRYENHNNSENKESDSENSAKEQTSTSDMIIVLADEESPAQTGTKCGTNLSADSVSAKEAYQEPEGNEPTESQPKFMARLADLHKRMAGKIDETDRSNQPRHLEPISNPTAKIWSRQTLPKKEQRGDSNSNSRASMRSIEENRRPSKDHSKNNPSMLNKRQPFHEHEPRGKTKVAEKYHEFRGNYAEANAQAAQYPGRRGDSRMPVATSQRHAVEHSSPETKRQFHRPEVPQPSSSTRYVHNRGSEYYKTQGRVGMQSRIKQEPMQPVRRHSPGPEFEMVSSNSRESRSRSSSEGETTRTQPRAAVASDYYRNKGRGLPTHRGKSARPTSVVRAPSYR